MSVGVLTKCRKRFITTLYAESFNDAPQVRQLQALRYVNNDEDCIVIRDEDDEGEPFSLPRSVFFPTLGCPVICHGLVNASHLNGKLGEVRSVLPDKSGSMDELRLGVYFEDKSLKSASVKNGNLRIAFVLPSV